MFPLASLQWFFNRSYKIEI